jgi:hypothetical protein
MLGYPRTFTHIPCADSELCTWSAGAGCGPVYTWGPSGAHAARGISSQPPLFPGPSPAPRSHYQRIRLGVLQSQQVQHGECAPRLHHRAGKGVPPSHAEPRSAGQRLQLRPGIRVGYDRRHLHQRTQVISIKIIGYCCY